MARPTIQTVNPDVVRSLLARIEQLERRVLGGLQPGDEATPKAADNILAATPAEGLKARSGSTIYEDASALYVQGAVSGGARTVSALVDGTPTALTLPVYCTEEVPMGGGVVWPTSLLKSGARQLEIGPCHVIGKPNGYGISAGTEDAYGVITPGTGSLDLYYHDTQADALTAWTIDSVQQTLSVLNYGLAAITDTDSFVLAHRDRWLRWWVESPPHQNAIEFYNAGNIKFSSAYTIELESAMSERVTGDWTVDTANDWVECVRAGWWNVCVNWRIYLFTGETPPKRLAITGKRIRATVTTTQINMDSLAALDDGTAGELMGSYNRLLEFQTGDQLYFLATPTASEEWMIVSFHVILTWVGT